MCHNTQVRTDLADLGVWKTVRGLLEHPERLSAEYRRRLHPHTQARGGEQTLLTAQLGKLRQGLVRLIDSYTEGLLEKREFEPRITRLRDRIAKVQDQLQHLANETAWQTELQLIVGRVEEFAAKVKDGLECADWNSRREIIRTLVKRVEVNQEHVNVKRAAESQISELKSFANGIRRDYAAVQKLYDPEMSKTFPRKETSDFYARLTARFGNDTLTAPRYDIEAARNQVRIESVADAKWGDPRTRTAEENAASGVAPPLPTLGAPLDASLFKYLRDLPSGNAGPDRARWPCGRSSPDRAAPADLFSLAGPVPYWSLA